MVSYESGFPSEPQHPSADLGRSAFVNLNKTKEGPSYGADDCFSDFSSLDKVKGEAHCKGKNVYMNIYGVWYHVIRWDTNSREVCLIEKGLVVADENSKFIVSSKERHLTKVR